MSVPTHQLETITVASGAFVGFGPQPGQKVKGYVTHYDPAGGTDFNGRVCPLLSVELTEATHSMNKEMERTDFAVGDEVSITCGQANLKRTVQGGALHPGDYIELDYVDTQKTANGTVKLFTLGVARGARPVAGAPTTVTPPAAVTPPTPAAPAAGALTDDQKAAVYTMQNAGLTPEAIATTLGVDLGAVRATLGL